MALIDRIKYDGPKDGQPWIVYKFPSEQLALGSQLIVNRSQEVLLFIGGEASDTYGAGAHTLITGNLPLLNKLVNHPFGGQTPFTAEVYYINMTARLDMRWDTSVPFSVEDPKYGLYLSVKASGQYGVTIMDSRKFVLQIIGASVDGAISDYSVITSYFNGIINTKIKQIVSTYMVRKQISFLEITTYLDKISKRCKKAINEEFERFGVEVLNFYVQSINSSEEDGKKLRELLEEKARQNILDKDKKKVIVEPDSEVIVKSLKDLWDLTKSEIDKYIESYKKAIAIDPSNKDINFAMGICYLKLGLYDFALKFFLKAVEDLSGNPDVYFYTAVCQLKGKKAFLTPISDIRKAEEFINAALRLEDKGIYHYFMAYIKYDFYERKHLNISPNYMETLELAHESGASQADVQYLFELLNVTRPNWD